jgi:DNA-directed RNA polymerase subunit RPC12/RpoP
MAVRVCPHCKTEISASESAARSNDITCPKCGARLEVASGGRTISTVAGILAAAIVWKLTSAAGGDLGAIAPTLYAFLAFGIVSPLVLMVSANLRNAPPAPIAEPAHASASHGASSHSPASHGSHH